MKRLLRIFDLSKNEQRVVLIVILALIAGALVRYERRIHLRPAEAAAAANRSHLLVLRKPKTSNRILFFG
jgi:phage baseplate assembly protein W